MSKKMKERTKVDVLPYCIKTINRRIQKAEAELRQLRVVKAVLTKSPKLAVVITMVYPQNERQDLKVEMTCPWGNVATQMRRTEQQFSTSNPGRNFGAQRAVVRVAGPDCFGQVEIPAKFWTSGQMGGKKS